MSGKPERSNRNEYHRNYQKAHYAEGRKESKKEYYLANSASILGRQHYAKMARIFRNIMTNV